LTPLHCAAFQIVLAAYSGTAKNFSSRMRGSSEWMVSASSPMPAHITKKYSLHAPTSIA
jgi:hypothetical protein